MIVAVSESTPPETHTTNNHRVEVIRDVSYPKSNVNVNGNLRLETENIELWLAMFFGDCGSRSGGTGVSVMEQKIRIYNV